MKNFWAKTTSDNKPGISVFQHMINVGCVAKRIAETSPELLIRFNLQSELVGALAALHDLGKISPGFQRKCIIWLKDNDLLTIDQKNCWDTGTEPDHGKVSHASIQDFLVSQGVGRSVAKYVAAVLGAHHGRLKYLPNDRGIKPPFIKPIIENVSGINWEMERQEYAKRMWGFFDVGSFSDEFLSGESFALWWFAGLTSVADWIGSDERFFSAEFEDLESNDNLGRAHNALESIGFIPPVVIPNLSFEQIFGFSPNEMQVKALSSIIGPGVYVIEAPMGMGKTEAALGVAYNLLSAGKVNGIYFALPTQATSNRIHLRVNEFLQHISSTVGESRLIHGNSWLLKDELEYEPAVNSAKEKPTEDARCGRDWFASAKRALLAPFGVGTIDQALLGVVAAKHFFVRHFALAGKVVILDEVHSYDLYTGTLIDKLITTLEGLGCIVIVLSATLTGKRRDQILSTHADENVELPYPLISGRTENNILDPVSASAPKSRNVEIEFIDSEAAVDEALKTACKGGAVLWICNTVGAAQKYFNRFKGLVPDNIPLGLLHSRFPHWRREELEQSWMERFGKKSETRCACILVSTQVVEQSVDLDADLLVTELAPTDMILQRIGRLWRHDRGNRPVAVPRVCIIEEEVSLNDLYTMSAEKIKKVLGNKSFVYDPYILLRTLKVWRGRSEILIPKEIRSVIEATYQELWDEPEQWQVLSDENYAKICAYRQKALMSSNVWQVALEDQEGVQTRLNETPTVAIVLCRNITGKDVQFVDGTSAEFSSDGFIFATAKAIHRNLVKVPEYCFARVEPCPELDEYIYENLCIGIVDKGGVVTVMGLKDKLRLHYSNEVGLYIEKLSIKEEV